MFSCRCNRTYGYRIHFCCCCCCCSSGGKQRARWLLLIHCSFQKLLIKLKSLLLFYCLSIPPRLLSCLFIYCSTPGLSVIRIIMLYCHQQRSFHSLSWCKFLILLRECKKIYLKFLLITAFNFKIIFPNKQIKLRLLVPTS